MKRICELSKYLSIGEAASTTGLPVEFFEACIRERRIIALEFYWNDLVVCTSLQKAYREQIERDEVPPPDKCQYLKVDDLMELLKFLSTDSLNAHGSPLA